MFSVKISRVTVNSCDDNEKIEYMKNNFRCYNNHNSNNNNNSTDNNNNSTDNNNDNGSDYN